jgi:hypothetical protein
VDFGDDGAIPLVVAAPSDTSNVNDYGPSPLSERLTVGVSLSAEVAPVATVPTLVRR